MNVMTQPIKFSEQEIAQWSPRIQELMHDHNAHIEFVILMEHLREKPVNE